MFQKTKYLLIGLVTGLIMATATFALAGNPIKLIINGQEIQCDVSPQNINGRVLVPARFVAESLGASVAWDGVNNAVVNNIGYAFGCGEKIGHGNNRNDF